MLASMAVLTMNAPTVRADDAQVIRACLQAADADNGKPHDRIGRIADACLEQAGKPVDPCDGRLLQQ